MANLKDSMTWIKSDKARERESGIEAYREMFSQQTTFELLSTHDNSPRKYKAIIQSLFQNVVLEKEQCLKKGGIEKATPSSIKRLQDASNMVKTMMEIGSKFYEKEVTKMCLAHLVQMLDHKSEVFKPIAHDYIRAIKALLLQPFHLVSLEPDQWQTLVNLFFNLVFGRKLKETISNLDESFWIAPEKTGEQESASPSKPGKTSTTLEVVDAMECLELLMSSGQAPLITPLQLGALSLAQYLSFLEEFSGESSAHLHAITGLNHLLANLEFNERDILIAFATRAWSSLLALWTTRKEPLKEQLVITFRILLPALAYPIPFRPKNIAAEKAEEARAPIRLAQLRKLQKLIVEEGMNRTGCGTLSLASFELAPQQPQRTPHPSPFSYRSFRGGKVISSSQALSWACLELGADVTAHLLKLEANYVAPQALSTKTVGETGRNGAGSGAIQTQVKAIGSKKRVASTSSNVGTQSNPGGAEGDGHRTSKKRRVGSEQLDLVSASVVILSQLSSPGTSSTNPLSSIWCSQLILFLVERHWETTTPSLRSKIVALIDKMVLDESVEVNSQAYVTLAAIIVAQKGAGCLEGEMESAWERIWNLAIRKHISGPASRAAAHAASALLSSNLIPREIIMADLKSFLSGIDVTGPPSPQDSVCAFLTESIQKLSGDAVYSSSKVEEHVLLWLSLSWSPLEGTSKGFSNTRTKVEACDPIDIVHLLGHVCRLPRLPQIERTALLLPTCDIVSRVVSEFELSAVRDFFWQAKLSRAENPSQSNRESTTPLSMDNQVESRAMENIEKRCGALLEKGIQDFLFRWDGAYSQSFTQNLAEDLAKSCSAEQVRLTLDMVSITLLWIATLHLNYVRTDPRESSLASFASQLLGLLSPVLAQPRWQAASRVVIMKGLEPLLGIQLQPELDSGSIYALCEPGSRSGTSTAAVSSSGGQRQQTEGAGKRNNTFLTLVWRIPELENSLPHLLQAAEVSLTSVAGGLVELETRGDAMDLDDDDDFGTVRSSSTTRKGPSNQPRLIDIHLEPRAVQTSIAICLSILADVPRLRRGLPDAESCQDIIQTVLDQDLHVLENVGPALFEAVAQSRLHLTQIDATAIIQVLGNQMLASHQYGRSDSVKMLTVDFLESTMHSWLQESSRGSDLAIDAGKLMGFLSDCVMRKKAARMSWKLRVRVCRFFLRYLDADPPESFWFPGPGHPDPSSKTKSASNAVIGLNGDEDLRARFSAASMSARLAETTQQRGMSIETLQATMEQYLKLRDETHYERVLNRILALGNSLVASSATRHESLKALISVAMDFNGEKDTPALFDSHVRSVLRGGAERLGYDDVPTMIYQFAPVIAFHLSMSEDTLIKLPYEILGYSSIREGTTHLFKPFAAVFLCANVQMGSIETALRIITQKSLLTTATDPLEVLARDCLPLVVAQVFCISAMTLEEQGAITDQDRQKEWRQELKEVTRRLKTNNFNLNVEELLPSICDQVIVSIVSLCTQHEEDADNTILEHLNTSENSTAAKAFKRMSGRMSKESTLSFHKPPPPAFSASSVCEALRILQAGGVEVFSDSTAYHVIRQMLSLVHSTRQLNEQVRLVEALKLYISTCSEIVQGNHVLLSIILRGATALLSQVDLADSALGLVEWCFDAAYKLDHPVPALGASALRIMQISQAYQSRESNQVQTDLGLSLEKRLIKILRDLLQAGEAQSSVANALRIWPKRIPAELQDIIGDPDLEELTVALQSTSTAALSAAFLARFKVALLSLPPDQKLTFASDTIWCLLDRIPEVKIGSRSASLRSAELASALADLFYECQGHLRTPEVRTLNGIWKPESAPLIGVTGEATDQTGSLKCFLVQQIVNLESSERIVDSDRSFRCLRAVLSGDYQLSGEAFRPKGMSEELNMLSAFNSPLAPRSIRSPHTLQKQDAVEKARSFKDWTTFFATYLCDVLSNMGMSTVEEEDGTFYAQISPLVAVESELSKQLLPSLLHALLLEENLMDLDTARENISSYFTKILQDPESDPQVWTAIIESVLQLRNHRPPRGDLAESPLGSDRWLELEFIELSQRALDCRQFTTSLLFVELSKEHAQPTYVEQSSQVSSLLYEAYSNVDDPDGFYGIKNPDLRGSLLQQLHHEGEWSKAFELHASHFESATAIANSTSTSSSSIEVNRSLHELGFNRLAATLSSSKPSGSAPREGGIAFDVAWRTGSWDAVAGGEFRPGTSQGLFSALRSLHRELDQKVADSEISKSLALELNGLRGLGIEASTAVRRVSSDLMCLNVTRQWRSQVIKLRSAQEAITTFTYSWPGLSENFDFSNYERLLMVRQSVLQSERQRHELDQIGDMVDAATLDATRLERSLLLRLSSGARLQGKLQNSINAVTLAQCLDEHLGSNSDSHLVTEEFANVLWEQGHQAIAIQALSGLQSEFASSKSRSASGRMPAVLATLGQWHATARSQPPRTIDKEYFSVAHSMLSKNSDKDARALVCYRYAVFADEQYQALRNLPEIAQIQVFISQREREVTEHERIGRQRGVRINHLKAAEDALANDRAKVAEHESAKQLFLVQSTSMYAEALQHSERYNDKVMRFVALWFENSENKQLNESLPEILKRIPSHKLIILTHQLSSRLSGSAGPTSSGARSPQSKFQRNLMDLMLRMCQEHPFHLLFTIYALKNGGSSTESAPSPTASSSASDRAAAAIELWNKVSSLKALKQKVQAIEQTCDAAVEWSRISLDELISGRDKVNGKHGWNGMGLQLERLVNVEVPVLTAAIPISTTSQYVVGKDCVGISKYQSGFTIAGGVHKPKISKCLGTDGNEYTQLFKAEDDLRQDAVFQQVFRLVNTLLQKDRRASQRLLKIRTYVVMPLGPQEGLLEFVGNTQAICEPLVAMHRRHQPGLDIQRLRSKLAAHDRSPIDWNARIKAYKDVCAQMPPTFRHYFWNTQKLPSAWFAMRLNYTRSVATNSIVGHLLGLGDRHVSNILLDNSTGEVVHIDFGVAFDQGKLLPIPEKVPFRLTRDFVDGMGIFGVDGTFRRSCEETLRVLREGKDIIQTVLDVLKYDPLFTWTSNPVQLNQVQSTEAPPPRGGRGRNKTIEPSSDGPPQAQGTAEIIAEQAINTILTKLSPTLRTESTVNELIEQARDENNLGSIFSGLSILSESIQNISMYKYLRPQSYSLCFNHDALNFS